LKELVVEVLLLHLSLKESILILELYPIDVDLVKIEMVPYVTHLANQDIPVLVQYVGKIAKEEMLILV
jgi:hypothetical protein